MKVTPTMEGGLRIDIESPLDWTMLCEIPQDASEETRISLPEELGALMDEEAEWGDLVVPELAVHFSGQLARVASAVAQAQEAGDAKSGELFIPRPDAEQWYGALNQARLALESHYRFGPTEEIEEIASFPPPKRLAFMRSQFYCTLQSVLLEYAMD